MNIKDIYSGGLGNSLSVSLEVFPPKGEDSAQKTDDLLAELGVLKKYKPAFVSVTYGAGGSTREKTMELVSRIKNELGIVPMPHFTCVGGSRNDILSYIKDIEKADIKNILALRGDPPAGEEKFVKPVDGFGYANELVSFIRENVDMGVAVAGYPECHQESKCLDEDIANLKRKVESGADAIITQVFYDNARFFEFVEKVRAAGIDVPVIPGILPITSLTQIERIVSMCSCSIPSELMSQLRANKSDKEAVKKIGVSFAIDQCRDLIAYGVKGIHFYTLNKAYATDKVLRKIL